jgi:hypothetical protein
MAAVRLDQPAAIELGLGFPYRPAQRANVVTSVKADSPVERAGIRVDAVVAFDGRAHQPLKGAIMQTNNASPACPVTPGDINIYHARSIADQQITYVLEFSSILDLDRLNRAFAVLVRAFPILSYVIRVEAFRFQREPILGYCPEASLADEVESVSDTIARFTGTACDPEYEPPLKLLLIRRSGRDTLCLKTDHVAY